MLRNIPIGQKRRLRSLLPDTRNRILQTLKKRKSRHKRQEFPGTKKQGSTRHRDHHLSRGEALLLRYFFTPIRCLFVCSFVIHVVSVCGILTIVLVHLISIAVSEMSAGAIIAVGAIAITIGNIAVALLHIAVTVGIRTVSVIVHAAAVAIHTAITVAVHITVTIVVAPTVASVCHLAVTAIARSITVITSAIAVITSIVAIITSAVVVITSTVAVIISAISVAAVVASTISHATSHTRSVVEILAFIVAAAAVRPPTVFAIIAGIIVGAIKIELVAVGIARIDAITEPVIVPVSRAEEIIQSLETGVFRTAQDIRQIDVAPRPIRSIEVLVVVETEEIIIIDFVGGFILVFGEIQFVSHFVGQEERNAARCAAAHRVCRY